MLAFDEAFKQRPYQKSKKNIILFCTLNFFSVKSMRSNSAHELTPN